MIAKSLLVFLINVVLTVSIETIAAVLLRIRNKYDLLLIALFNINTNIGINILYYAAHFFTSHELVLFCVVIVLEIIVFFVEAQLFKRNLATKRNCYLVSFVLNLSSYLLGMLIYYFFLNSLLGL